MGFEKENLDIVLVPSGLLIMFGYHLYLLYRCLYRPHTTVIGFENNDRKAWVERIMQVKKTITHFLIFFESSNFRPENNLVMLPNTILIWVFFRLTKGMSE